MIYITAKTIQTKTYTIFSLGISLDKKLKDQSRALHSPVFSILHHKSSEWTTYIVFSLHTQNQKDPYKISFSEPAALSGSDYEVTYTCCVFVTLPCGILGHVWYLIVSILDLCHLSYFCDLNFSMTDHNQYSNADWITSNICDCREII